jgi:hypothetical protein
MSVLEIHRVTQPPPAGPDQPGRLTHTDITFLTVSKVPGPRARSFKPGKQERRPRSA